MKAKEDYALAKEEIETGTATVLKGIVDEMLIPRWPQEFLGRKNAGVGEIHMSQNKKYGEFVIGISHDAALLVEIWGAFQKLFGDHVEEVIAALTPVAEALAGPILFGNEPPDLSEEELERLIRTVDNSQHLNTPPKKYGADRYRHPQKTHIHYNYIPRTPKNLPYQKRAY